MPDDARNAAQPQKGYTRRDAWRDILLGLVILLAVVFAYFFGRHRRVSHLNAFAQCLTARQAKMYGAYWCPHCAEQKELFGASFQYVPYVECGQPGTRVLSASCLQSGIRVVPTWVFSGSEHHEGTLQLKALSEKTGCALP